MQDNYKAENKHGKSLRCYVRAYLSIGGYTSCPAPYSCYVTYHLVLTTLRTYTYLFH